MVCDKSKIIQKELKNQLKVRVPAIISQVKYYQQ